MAFWSLAWPVDPSLLHLMIHGQGHGPWLLLSWVFLGSLGPLVPGPAPPSPRSFAVHAARSFVHLRGSRVPRSSFLAPSIVHPYPSFYRPSPTYLPLGLLPFVSRLAPSLLALHNSLLLPSRSSRHLLSNSTLPLDPNASPFGFNVSPLGLNLNRLLRQLRMVTPSR